MNIHTEQKPEKKIETEELQLDRSIEVTPPAQFFKDIYQCKMKKLQT